MLQRIGRYEILERIAAGGQGTVYRARDIVLDRVVAVKVINQPVTDDPAYLEALQSEARLAAGLDHPNITTVYDFQVEGDTAYIVMEYVPDALDRHLQGGSPLPWQRATEIAAQVARALQHAHDNGVIHRDIKPQNILLTEDGTVKVSDFGIARARASSTRSRTSSVMGTPQYMAPEQWSGCVVDGKLDQYALGIVFYEMLAGTPPFQGDSMEAIYVQHRDSPMPALPAGLGVPGAVERVIRRATEKTTDARFRSADDMAGALEGALGRTPAAGAPTPPSIPPQPPPVGAGAGGGRKGMVKGVFLALGIMLVSLLIPLLHFVAFPASPFIGGYFGIKFAHVPKESYAAKCLMFGALLGSLFLIPVSLAAILVVTLADFGQRFLVIIGISVVVLTLYTGSMSTLGAMFSVCRSGGQSSEPAEVAP